MELIIRDFKIEDAEEIAKMVEHTIEENYKWVYSESVRQWFKRKNSPQKIKKMARVGYVLIAVDPDDGNRIVGTGVLINNNIQGFYVHPDYRRNDIGIRLMEKLEDRAIANGLKRIKLRASISSRDFYQKLAYKGIPRIERLNDGIEFVVYDMEKNIE